MGDIPKSGHYCFLRNLSSSLLKVSNVFFRSTFSKASICEIVQVCSKIKRQKWKQEVFVIKISCNKKNKNEMPAFHDFDLATNFWNNSQKISKIDRKREIFQIAITCFFRSTFSKASIFEIVHICNKIKRQK